MCVLSGMGGRFRTLVDNDQDSDKKKHFHDVKVCVDEIRKSKQI